MIHHSKRMVVKSLNQVVKAIEDSALTLHKLSVCMTRGLAKTICQVLQNCNTLYTLELRGLENSVKDDLLPILHFLQGNSTLRELSLFGGIISFGNIIEALFEMIEHNETILTLTIDPDIICRHYNSMARALLQNTTLQNLYMSSGVDELKETIRQLKLDENVSVHPNWNLKIEKK